MTVCLAVDDVDEVERLMIMLGESLLAHSKDGSGIWRLKESWEIELVLAVR